MGCDPARRLGNSLETFEPARPATQVNTAKSVIHRLLILVGNSLALIGCVALTLGAIGLVSADSFATDISSGVRVIGSVAITGCLLSAIGYGIVDYLEE